MTVSVQPLPEQTASLYDRDYFQRWYLSCADSRGQYLSGLFRSLKKYLPKPGRLLDVGCGTGIFLEVAARNGWQVLGEEISPFAVSWCRQHGFTIAEGPLTEVKLPENSFDLVTFWDVLAHVPEAPQYLAAAGKLLKSGGLILVKTPCHQVSLFRMARLFSFTGKSRALLHVPAQLHHFNSLSLARVLAGAGFKQVKIMEVKEHSGQVKFSSNQLSSYLFFQVKRLKDVLGLRKSLVGLGCKPGAAVTGNAQVNTDNRKK
ncbi:MAG TPA: class I SAM-dependent methyltransferase [bacterium]|nr:class I SAM-dependent methyltransferase [bacterium]